MLTFSHSLLQETTHLQLVLNNIEIITNERNDTNSNQFG